MHARTHPSPVDLWADAVLYEKSSSRTLVSNKNKHTPPSLPPQEYGDAGSLACAVDRGAFVSPSGARNLVRKELL